MNERFQWTNFVFLRDGPKRGFVYEELLVVPANTKQQTLQRYSICSVWMLSGSFFCLLFIGEYHPCVYSNSCFRDFPKKSIQRGFVSLPAQFVLALRALFWGHFRLSFVVLHRAIPRLCRRTPAGTALAFALSICATQTILFCLLWTLLSCRGVLPLPFNQTTTRGTDYGCPSGSARNHACLRTCPNSHNRTVGPWAWPSGRPWSQL